MYRIIFGNQDPVSVSNKDDVIATLLQEHAAWTDRRVMVIYPDGYIERRG
jgi:hypothetical protein